MTNKLMGLLAIVFILLEFHVDSVEAEDICSYIPYFYSIPEGRVGVFKNGKQFYDELYPAGCYPVWPYDEGFTIKITPQKETVRDIPCTTIEGVIIHFPAITVHYHLDEQKVLGLVKSYGAKYANSLIKIPVSEGMAELCSTMTAEAIYLDGFAITQQALTTYLSDVQEDKVSGLTIDKLEITEPLPEQEITEITEPLPEQERMRIDVHREAPDIDCEPPYEIFSTLEDEAETRGRLCGSDEQPIDDQMEGVTYSTPIVSEEADLPSSMSGMEENDPYLIQQTQEPVLENVSPVVHIETDPEVIPSDESKDNTRLSINKPVQFGIADSNTVNHADMSRQLPVQSLDHHLDNTTDPEVSEVGNYTQPERLKISGEKVSEAGHKVLDIDLDFHFREAPIQPSKPNNSKTLADTGRCSRESVKSPWYQQMQDSKGLWKNNNGRLYLSW